MRTRSIRSRSRTPVRIGVVLALTAAGLFGLASPALAANDASTISPAKGPSGGGNTIIATNTAGANWTAGTTYYPEFSTSSCGTTYAAPVDITTSSATANSAGIIAAAPAIATSTTKIPIVVPSGVQLKTSGTALQTSSTWYVCIYVGSTATSSAIAGSTSAAAYQVANPGLTLSAISGPAGGGNTLTVTTSSGTISAATPIEFQYYNPAVPAPCADKYVATADMKVVNGVQTGVIGVPTASVTVPAGTTGKLNVVVPATVAPAAGQAAATFNVCVYAGSTAGTSLLVSGAGTPYTAAGSNLTGVATQGPSGGGNTLTVTSNAAIPTGAAAEFQFAGPGPAAGCSTTYRAYQAKDFDPASSAQWGGVFPASLRNLAPTTKAAITVPSTASTGSAAKALALNASAPSQTTADYWLCIYSDSVVGTSTLVAAAPQVYTISAPATVTSVSPAAGAATGGTVITVVGTNFPANVTASIGGAALVIQSVSPNGKSFTATVPAHSPGGPYALSVTTAAGVFNQAKAFTFTNGIVVVPNVASSKKLTNTDIDVTGTGFSSLDWSSAGYTDGSTPNASAAHVYLVDGIYDGTSATPGKINGQVGECLNPLIVADNELVCQMNVATSLTNANTPAFNTNHIVYIASDSGPSATVTAVNGTYFSSSDVGMAIDDYGAGTDLPTTTVASVIDSTHAVLTAAPSTADLTGAPAAITGNHTNTADTTDGSVTGSNTIHGQANFTAIDIGRIVTGTNIPPGTILTAISTADPKVATISQPATANTTSGSFTLTTTNPVADGTYTITVVSNGARGANTTDTNFSQTVISSFSTFTVADY